MESHLAEESVWANALAARLKLLQANFADDPPATRQNFLLEEIERAVKDVSPSRRKVFLRALEEQFPAWQAGSRAPAPAAPAAAAEPETPEQIAERLIAGLGSMTPEQRASLAVKLQDAGLALGGSGSLPELSPEFQKKLGLAPGQALNAERAVKLLVGLTDLTLALDQLVWALWKQMAPRSNVRKEAEIAKLLGPYLSGDPEVSTQQLAQPLERTRKLIAGLMGAVGRAGSLYAKKHVSRFSPELIEDWARMEKKWNESLEQRAWKKYLEHAKEFGSEPAIENEIQEAIAKAAENLMLGRSAM